MKVFVLAPHESWICDRIAKEWHDYMGHISTNNVYEADILWLLAGWCWNHVPQEILAKKKVVLTEHHIVPEKFDNAKQQLFLYRDQFVDAYHVPNKFTEKFLRTMTSKPIYVLGYWFDPKTWFKEDKKKCREELRLPKDKFIVGSFQRDTEGGSRNPKLEKGPDIFCDYLEGLMREDLHILLGGWRREYVVDRLNNVDMSYTLIEKTSIDIVRKMYNACDLYVVASRYEGGPQAIYEASAMKVPIISTNVGVASEILSEASVIDLPVEFYYPTPHDVDLNYKHVQQYSIIKHALKYANMLGEISS